MGNLPVDLREEIGIKSTHVLHQPCVVETILYPIPPAGRKRAAQTGMIHQVLQVFVESLFVTYQRKQGRFPGLHYIAYTPGVGCNNRHTRSLRFYQAYRCTFIERGEAHNVEARVNMFRLFFPRCEEEMIVEVQ